jgi:hypothetical protein
MSSLSHERGRQFWGWCVSDRDGGRSANTLAAMITALAVIALLLSAIAVIAGVLALRTLGQLRRSVTILNRGADQSESLLEASGRHATAAAHLAARHSEVAESVDRLRAHVDSSTSALRGHVDTSSAALRGHVDTTSAALRGEFAAAVHHLSEETSRGLRRVALVRYDAFDDLAGRMSFSLALLDDHGDGITMSAIVGRNDTRVYAKGISGGAPQGRLAGSADDDETASRRSSSGRDTVTSMGVELSPEEQQAISAALSPAHAAPYPATS